MANSAAAKSFNSSSVAVLVASKIAGAFTSAGVTSSTGSSPVSASAAIKSCRAALISSRLAKSPALYSATTASRLPESPCRMNAIASSPNKPLVTACPVRIDSCDCKSSCSVFLLCGLMALKASPSFICWPGFAFKSISISCASFCVLNLPSSLLTSDKAPCKSLMLAVPVSRFSAVFKRPACFASSIFCSLVARRFSRCASVMLSVLLMKAIAADPKTSSAVASNPTGFALTALLKNLTAFVAFFTPPTMPPRPDEIGPRDAAKTPTPAMDFCVPSDKLLKLLASCPIFAATSVTTGARASPSAICAPSTADCMRLIPPFALSSMVAAIAADAPSAFSRLVVSSSVVLMLLARISKALCAFLPTSSFASARFNPSAARLSISPATSPLVVPSSEIILRNAVPALLPRMPLFANDPSRAVVCSTESPAEAATGATLFMAS